MIFTCYLFILSPCWNNRAFHQKFNIAYFSQKLFCGKGKCSKKNKKTWTCITFSKVYKSLLFKSVPFNLFKLDYSNSILPVQLASSQCFSPNTKAYSQFNAMSMALPIQGALSCHCCLYNPTHPWEQISSPIPLWSLHQSSQPSFSSLCPLNNLHSWSCISQFGS